MLVNILRCQREGYTQISPKASSADLRRTISKEDPRAIDDSIRVYDKLLLILSDAIMNSNWVKTEIANTRAREEQQKRQMLFPITLAPHQRIKQWKLFDADTGIDSARLIREYFIPDFSNWKDHDSYRAAFERLLRDLKAGSADKTSA